MSHPSILSALQKLRSLLIRKEKLKLMGIVGFAACISMLELLTTSVIVIFAQVLNQPEVGITHLSRFGFNSDISSARIVLYISLIVGAVYIVKNLVAVAEVFYQNFSIQKMNYHFKNRLLNRYAEADYGFYLTRNSSFTMAVVGSDVERMFSSGMIALASIISEGMVFLCLITLVIFMDPTLALMVFGVGALLLLIVIKGLLPQFYSWGQRVLEASMHCGQSLQQFFHAFKEIVLLDKREAFVKAYQCHSLKISKIQAIQTATNALPRIVIETLFVGLFVTSIAFLCLEHESPKQMMGVLAGYLYLGFRVMPALNRIINQMNNFKAIIPAIERIHSENNIITAKENYLNVPNLSFKESLTLTDVYFRYINTHKDVLKHINIEIKKDECIGIIGETGSGKSTLVDVILGLLKAHKGSVLIDNQYPVNSYQWHEKIGYVPQSVYLTDDTIEANIAFGETSETTNQVRLNQAIDSAQLRKFINQLPMGTKTIVGERGIRLSGGERQRIAIARALYRNPDVLIFDEATSALDNETETRLMETIATVSQNRTVIMIAHRLTTLKDCDRILIMDGGMVKQITNYHDLKEAKIKNYG